MKYKCVIFDCDGVLVDSEAISAQVLVEMTKELELSINLDQAIDEFSGKSFHGIISYIEKRIEGDLPENFESCFREKTFALFKSELQPIKGIHKMLNGLSIPFCVASSGPRKKIVLNLTKVNLIDKFPQSNIFSSFEIGSWKPDPNIYLFAAKQMGFEPGECAVVEDSVYGVQAAISGGFDTYVYAKGRKKKIFGSTGAIVFDDMDNLETLLNS
ncbi:MAG: HAD family hydrolase [Maribacter sp.]|nr:HAD family hydrolase [Maribacter sp.]